MLRSIALPIYAPTLILAFCRGLLVPVLPLYVRQEFAISYAIVGLVLASEGLGTL
ncbi:MAG: MFS transporter, partial [Caldilineae bacterium]